MSSSFIAVAPVIRWIPVTLDPTTNTSEDLKDRLEPGNVDSVGFFGVDSTAGSFIEFQDWYDDTWHTLGPIYENVFIPNPGISAVRIDTGKDHPDTIYFRLTRDKQRSTADLSTTPIAG